MEILFLVLYISSSSLVYSVASDQRLGFNPYPFGTTILCVALHLPILVSCIFYMGWLWGIVCFLLHLLGIIHATVGWIFNIPTLVASNEKQLLRCLKRKLWLLVPVLMANIIFTVASLFVDNFKSLLNMFKNNSTFTVMIIIIITILSILRVAVSKMLSSLDAG